MLGEDEQAEKVIASFTKFNESYNMHCDCTVIEALGVIDSIVEHLVTHTGISREEILENFKEPKGE